MNHWRHNLTFLTKKTVPSFEICSEFVTWVSFHKRRSFSTLVSSLRHPLSRYLIFKTWHSTVFQLLYDEAKSHLPNIEQVNQLANSFIREAKVQKISLKCCMEAFFRLKLILSTAAQQQTSIGMLLSVCFFFWTGRNNFWPRWVTWAILGHSGPFWVTWEIKGHCDSGPFGSLRLFWAILVLLVISEI